MQLRIAAIALLFTTLCCAQNTQISLGLTEFEIGPETNPPIAVADVNGDGKPDIIANEFSAIAVLLGNGDGTFQPRRRSRLPGIIGGHIAVADFDGDGRPDIAAGTNKQLLLLLGNGDGTFQQARKFRITFDGIGAAAADLNGNGKLDVIVGGTGKVAILLGKGDGSFQPPTDYGTGDLNDYTLAVADFNGDGKLDIATTGAYGGQGSAIAILYGNGDGTFGRAVQYSSAYPLFVLSADFNRDGHADLAVQDIGTIPGNSTIGVLLGNGDGTFQPEIDYSGLAGNTGLTTGDFNGDGIADLVTVSNAGVAMILPGNGDGTFGIPTFAGLDGAPYDVASGDFDGDGFDDIATLNTIRGSVDVLRHGQSVLSETIVNFGHVPLGRQRTTPLTISNSGSTPFTITKTEILQSYSENFVETSVCDGKTILPGESCTLTLGYAPTEKAQLGGTLIITSDGTPGTQTVTLYGSTANDAPSRSQKGPHSAR